MIPEVIIFGPISWSGKQSSLSKVATMRLFRVKILFPIVSFCTGIYALVCMSNTRLLESAFSLTTSFNDTDEKWSQMDHQSEASNPVCQGMLAETNDKGCMENQTLPELIFVAGIEGSGHHLMRELFNSLAIEGRPKPYDVVFSPMMNMLDPGSIFNNQNMGFGIIRKRLFRYRLAPLLTKMNAIKKVGGRGMVVATNSFPMGLSALSTARPDLLVLKYFDCVLYRLKIIVTKRHPLLAITSTVSRFGNDRFAPYRRKVWNLFPQEDNPYIMQARITEDELIYLDQQVRRFSCDQLHFISMANIYSNETRQNELEELTEFLEFNDEETSTFLNFTLRAPETQISLPPDCADCINKVLYEFFEDRKDMWPLMV